MTKQQKEVLQKVQERLGRFLHLLGAHISKPRRKFLRDMVFGILTCRTPIVTDIARQLKETISLKKTLKRLDYHLRQKGLHHQISQVNLQTHKAALKQCRYLIVDLSDIQRSWSSRQEGLAQVHDGSTGKLGPGFWLCNAIGASADGQTLVPAWSDLYSLKLEATSENRKILDTVYSVQEVLDTPLIIVIDRGGDRSKLMLPLIQERVPFINRQVGNRNVYFKGEVLLVEELAKRVNLFANNRIWYNKDGAYVGGGWLVVNSIRYNSSTGAHVYWNGDSVRGNWIADNRNGIVCDVSTSPSILKNNITGNIMYGLDNSRSFATTITAEYNWWGDASGPGGVGPGSGDDVGLGVDYDPWLTQAVSVVAATEKGAIYAPPSTTLAVAAPDQSAALSNWVYFQNWAHLDDTLDVTLSDDHGWLLSSPSFTVTLAEELGGSALVSFTVPAGTPLGITDTVVITAVSQAEPTDSFTTTFQVVSALVADLAVEAHGPALVADTAPFTYAITVTNSGPDDASNVVLTDTLPLTATLLSVQTGQGSCAAQSEGVVCQLGTLTSGAQITLSVTAFLTPTAGTEMLNLVEVVADEHDAYPYDNLYGVFTKCGSVVHLPLVMRQF